MPHKHIQDIASLLNEESDDLFGPLKISILEISEQLVEYLERNNIKTLGDLKNYGINRLLQLLSKIYTKEDANEMFNEIYTKLMTYNLNMKDDYKYVSAPSKYRERSTKNIVFYLNLDDEIKENVAEFILESTSELPYPYVKWLIDKFNKGLFSIKKKQDGSVIISDNYGVASGAELITTLNRCFKHHYNYPDLYSVISKIDLKKLFKLNPLISNRPSGNIKAFYEHKTHKTKSA